jgi:hypothetical protein
VLRRWSTSRGSQFVTAIEPDAHGARKRVIIVGGAGRGERGHPRDTRGLRSGIDMVRALVEGRARSPCRRRRSKPRLRHVAVPAATRCRRLPRVLIGPGLGVPVRRAACSVDTGSGRGQRFLMPTRSRCSEKSLAQRRTGWTPCADAHVKLARLVVQPMTMCCGIDSRSRRKLRTCWARACCSRVSHGDTGPDGGACLRVRHASAGDRR